MIKRHPFNSKPANSSNSFETVFRAEALGNYLTVLQRGETVFIILPSAETNMKKK